MGVGNTVKPEGLGVLRKGAEHLLRLPGGVGSDGFLCLPLAEQEVLRAFHQPVVFSAAQGGKSGGELDLAEGAILPVAVVAEGVDAVGFDVQFAQGDPSFLLYSRRLWGAAGAAVPRR